MNSAIQYSRNIICKVTDLGVVRYQQAYQVQKKALTKAIAQASCEIFLCEHCPVITLGRLSNENNILLDPKEVMKKGIEILKVDRGGDVTFHTPGQLVVYPIFCLNYFGKDLKLFIFNLEQVVIDLLGYFGILASRIKGHTGVWVGPKKIASIGIGVQKWVSFHGLALNVTTHLKDFLIIKPCGLSVEMTSMENEAGKQFAMKDIKRQIVLSFKNIFNLEILS
ncbi:MAG: lipoyl(octanoyl) transferase LipB [Candidatus Omnitrophica bacterium]|nr:lipoyl(octanoyl) transferase LipB [Candidatus Omnitrophota bacterium]